MDPNAGRVPKLKKLFTNFLSGERAIKSSQDASHFYEAATVIAKKDTPAVLAERIISSASGIDALSVAVRSDLTPASIATTTLPFLRTFSDDSVKALDGGKFLHTLLIAVLVPTAFWSATLQAYHKNELQDAVLEAFAWLCLEICSRPPTETDLATHFEDVQMLMENKSLLEAASHEIRSIAYRIQNIIQLRSSTGTVADEYGAGGRHDNDFADFRSISIYPTTDEFLSSEDPYLPNMNHVFDASAELRPGFHLDWLFRLLREEMLGEIREDLGAAWGTIKKRHRTLCFSDLRLARDTADDSRRPSRFVFNLACNDGDPVNYLRKMSEKKRKQFVEEKKTLFKHGSFCVLCVEKNIIAFGTVVREPSQLMRTTPVIGIHFTNNSGLKAVLNTLNSSSRELMKLYVMDTAVFAFEPILKRLQDISDLPLQEALVDPSQSGAKCEHPPLLKSMLESLSRAAKNGDKVNLSRFVPMKTPISVCGAQLKSLVMGLEMKMGLIQGPPGTGKSFIGALIILILLRLTKYRVLVLSYTNHALDQFLSDLEDVGIAEEEMVRIGSKSTERTSSMRLEALAKGSSFRFSGDINRKIISQKAKAEEIYWELAELKKRIQSGVQPFEILDMLEFSEDDSFYWDAFQVPQQEDGYQVAGKNNRPLRPQDAYVSWVLGKTIQSVGSLGLSLGSAHLSVWEIPMEQRQALDTRWRAQVREEQISEFCAAAQKLDQCESEISSLYSESKRKVLQARRVIGCTTTGASMYQSIIKTATPDVVLVEEAGEILEAHVITALGPSVKQLTLIGDHKQLRPKVNNYKLTVEKGDGYDLNVSLFERLILQGHVFSTLEEQHRCHPDISHFTRLLAYENLKDSPKTYQREKIRGLGSRVLFVNHEHPEDDLLQVGDRGELGSTSSKRNAFEAQMVLKLVRYLGQQGYKSTDMVVLTPYLGQLSLLRDTLLKEHDPTLNDLDSHEMVRAGLMTPAAAKLDKKPLRLSTIDNYQGEESDIVIVSLTRSNADGNIGFLAARERLVVLASRARKQLVLFGNMNTLLKSKKGAELWKQFLGALKDRECLHDGVPVFCERHPERRALLKHPEDFDKNCPDGGCSEPCGAALGCGKHTCDRRCHRLTDHSNVPCAQIVESICKRGHKTKHSCSGHEGGKGCSACAREDQENRRRIARDLELERKRQQQQDEYARKLQEVEDEIDHLRRTMKYQAQEEELREKFSQKKAHLQSLKDTEARKVAAESAMKQQQEKQASQRLPTKTKEEMEKNEANLSNARSEWEFLKNQENSANEALDQLMKLIGLESVKETFLDAKSGIDTKIRQGVSLTNERFSCTLLGNPGTGKTTVARLWGKFLTIAGAIPGETFEETTGSKLASNGVPGCEKLLEKIKDDGGGVLFIDEAYQLSSGNNPGGKAVLDYLLAEVENLRGKVTFILAGYSKQMESFFAHNPGFPSRFPITMKFQDYSDDELLRILTRQLMQKFNGAMQVEGGLDGRLINIVAERVGRGRGKEGFGNARAMENALAVIQDRQSKRLRQERRKGKKTNDLCLTKEDLLGPEPAAALKNCKAWEKLSRLTGLIEVKQAVKVFCDTLTTNYHRELAGEPLIQYSLNKLFLGSPGTGKTTVAKLYGQILADLGFLSNGEVVVKNPADFVGSALGQSEAQTKGILASTAGKVLVIDEAYSLYGDSADTYKTAVVDTLVAEVQSVPGDDRCVLLLGYQDQMERMFQSVNPGLSRRFPIGSAFIFEDFNDKEMEDILNMKLSSSGFRASKEARVVALDVLSRARNRPNFGNAGEIDILLDKAKTSHQKRYSAGKAKPSVLEPVDFDEDFARATKGETDVRKLFEGEIGREELIEKLEVIQNRVREMKAIGMDVKDDIPFNFIFRGPPGTGKTTTARKMGRVYYDMGFLAKDEVVECSATDLIGQFVGQTGPKVLGIMDKALGRVLFIDEAYRLAGGHFAKEAIDELVDSVTKERYKGKLIIILAGYEKDINQLLTINPGLTSRFPETIDFAPLDSAECVKLLAGIFGKRKANLGKLGKLFDTSCLDHPSPEFHEQLTTRIEALTALEGWASARDVQQLEKNIWRRVDLKPQFIELEKAQVLEEVDKMLNDRSARAFSTQASSAQRLMQDLGLQQTQQPPPPRQLRTTTAIQTKDIETVEPAEEEQVGEEEGPSHATKRHATRDAGVSDEVWEQLQKNKAAEEQAEAEYQKLKSEYEAASAADRAKLVRQMIEEEDRRRKQAAVKKKLMQMGRCPAGFDWIKEGGGYRCAGGSHVMSMDEVEKACQN
ncbi:hypothetical protein S40288_08438 [Stachybotrys chartarum IBT 40288]|nr:hypothetical protein S40288_08438 [Stachybotrys chartarum IBT 40288]